MTVFSRPGPRLFAAVLAGLLMLTACTRKPERPSDGTTPGGRLDPDFGDAGKVVTKFGPFLERTSAVALQPDGKIVVVGRGVAPGGNQPDFLVARFDEDGQLDSGFGTGGLVTTDFIGGGDAAADVAIAGDGKIVAAGTSADPDGANLDFAVARYLPNGDLDTTFGSGGKVTTDFTDRVKLGPAFPGLPNPASGVTLHSSDSINSVAIQPDGKIVAAGYAGLGSNDFAVARYNADGSLDSGFGTRGTSVFSFAETGLELHIAHVVRLTEDGRIVVGGEAGVLNGNEHYAIAMLDPAGGLDAAFGEGGKVITGSGEERGSLRDLVIQPDGKIVATGDALGVALQPDGKIVATGDAFGKDSPRFQVVRYLNDGKLDEGFGTGGRASADFGEPLQVANSVALQADGKIVLAGAVGNLAGGGFDFALARFSRDGTLDQGFGNGGLVTTDLGSEGDSAVGLVIQPDGRIVAAGSTLPPPGAEDETTSSSNALVRYLP